MSNVIENEIEISFFIIIHFHIFLINKNYHSKLSSLVNQNVLLESKLESLKKDYLELQEKLNVPDKYQESGIDNE